MSDLAPAAQLAARLQTHVDGQLAEDGTCEGCGPTFQNSARPDLDPAHAPDCPVLRDCRALHAYHAAPPEEVLLQVTRLAGSLLACNIPSAPGDLPAYLEALTFVASLLIGDPRATPAQQAAAADFVSILRGDLERAPDGTLAPTARTKALAADPDAY